MRKQATEDGPDRLFLVRQRRLVCPPPHLLIRIREQGIDDVAKSRARVDTVFFDELLSPNFVVRHGAPQWGHYNAARAVLGRNGAVNGS